MRLFKNLLFFAALIIFLSSSYEASFAKTPGRKTITSSQRITAYQRHLNMKKNSLFRHLPWQFLGPTNISGRMTDIAVCSPRGKSYTIYAATASGGVWKTDNEGTTWEPIFENGPSTAFGDIAIAPSNQNILWIGTGEQNIFRSSNCGAGVFKSLDGGKTWQHMGLENTLTIARIIIHPKNPDIVYVASPGHEWTNNRERGVFKTTDGGKTWEKILYINEKTGATDIVMDPSDPNTLYAATWQRIRKKWNDPRNEKGYTGSGIYKTTDGGKTWRPINKGLPEARYRGRIGIDLCAAKPNVIYAFIDNYEIVRESYGEESDAYGRPKGGVIRGATVYRSDNSGETWTRVSEYNKYMEDLSGTYGWVFGQIKVDPVNENKVYVMGLFLNISEDGGKTYRTLDGMHMDHHGLWIDPENTDYLVNVNDGGLAISYDGGKNWRTFYNNFPVVQFFNVSFDMDTPFHVYGSVQDHGSYRGVVDLSKGRNFIHAAEWENAPGGEGSCHAIDPTDPNIVYSAGFYGHITRTNIETGESTNIYPQIKEGEPKLRGQWLAPFIISPHNPRILYFGTQYLYRSLDRGDKWERISKDLTYNDPKKIGDIPYQTIFSISESPLKFGLIYAGTDDGRAFVTKDSGVHWTEITKGLPKGKWVAELVASKYDQATVYMAQNGKRDDEFTPYIWKSTNYGKDWQDISSNIPAGPVNVIKEDPKNPNVLYVGTDWGVYVSIDKGRSWNTLADNLPVTFVHDLVIHPRDDIMVIATHGRGMWAMDVRYIQALNDSVLSSYAALFDTEPVTLPRWWWANPHPASIFYYLKSDTECKIQIEDSSGKIVKKLEATGDRGINYTVWDITTDIKSENIDKLEFAKPGCKTHSR